MAKENDRSAMAEEISDFDNMSEDVFAELLKEAEENIHNSDIRGVVTKIYAKVQQAKQIEESSEIPPAYVDRDRSFD